MKSRHIVLATLGGIAGVVILSAGLLVLSGQAGDGNASPAVSVGWAAPLVSLLVILAATALLLSRASSRPPADPPVSVPCGNCGRQVLRDWRLCPYCGAMLEHPEEERGPQAG